MPCDKDFGYVTLTLGLTWECYGDRWQLTCVTMLETTPEDNLIILREFLAGSKTFDMSSSIRAWVNYSRVWVNCSCVSIKLHLSCTIVWGKVKCCICHETLTKRLYISYKRSSSASSVLLYFTLKEVLAKYISLKFNALLTHYFIEYTNGFLW